MGKRKDSRGRVLKPGEGERPNRTYEYRYTDTCGNRRRVYAKTLDKLREKESEIQIADGINISAGDATVCQLVGRYYNLRRNLKQNSRRAYATAINRIKASPFGERKIKTVRQSDAKAFLISLHDSGLKQNTIGVIHNILRPAFQMAVEDDAIRKNPFNFRIGDVIVNDAYERTSLSKEQQQRYLAFIREYGNDNYYDDIEILLYTGLRVSELYGLTKSDIDFDKNRVSVNKQLCRTADKPYFITEPKTKSGVRLVPMTEGTREAFRRVLQKRAAPKVEMIIDGYAGFLFLDKNGKPKVGSHLQNYMRFMQEKYFEKYGHTIPRVTPHVLRHTFCTNIQQAGLDVKSLQYCMGHSSASVTLDVYTHTSIESVEDAFRKAASNL